MKMKRICSLILALLFVTGTAILPAPAGADEAEGFAGANVGDKVYFGRYEQNNVTSDGKEPILWRVLAAKNGKLLLLSEYALDCEQYNMKADSTGHTAPCTWKDSHLREWLNGTFYKGAFTAAEKKLIEHVRVENSYNPQYGNVDPGFDTFDDVFCLSVDEALKYLPKVNDLKCLPTAYAAAKGAYRDDSELVNGKAVCWWWLRTPGSAESRAAFVGGTNFGIKYDGGFVYAYHPTYPKAVRPAIWVSDGSVGPDPGPVEKEWAAGNTLYFGTYEQNGRKNDGAEKILWRVLTVENGKMLLLAQYGLDCEQYNLEADASGHTSSCTWQTSHLRDWLNNGFYQEAFTNEERESIIPTLIKNTPNPSYPKVNAGSDTLDRVFCLSIDEAKQYLKTANSLRCIPTTVAVRNGAYRDENALLYGKGSCWWWLRTPGSAGSRAVFVGGSNFGIKYDGGFVYAYNPTYPKTVRPAMWVSADIKGE